MIILHTCITQNIYLCFSITLALVGGFSSCFSDAILNTQVYSIFGQHYREKSTEAYALYKFIKVHDHVRTLVFSAKCCIKHLRLLVLIWWYILCLLVIAKRVINAFDGWKTFEDFLQWIVKESLSEEKYCLKNLYYKVTCNCKRKYVNDSNIKNIYFSFKNCWMWIILRRK